MLPLLVSVAFVQYWAIIGLSATLFLPDRLRANDADILVAPALGLAISLVPVFWLSRLGLPVKSFAAPVVASSLIISVAVIVLCYARRREGLQELTVRYFRIMPFLIISALVVTWPMLVQGFDWLGQLNDDMANDVLIAHRFVDTGYFGLPSLQSEFSGTDIPGTYWPFFVSLVGNRSGNYLMLAVWICVTGHNGFELIGGFLTALQTALVGATVGLAAIGLRHKSRIYAVLVLATLDPLFGRGTVLQLSAQTGGVALLVAAIYLIADIWNDAEVRASISLALVAALVIAATAIWYPEVFPILGGAGFLYALMNYKKWMKSKNFYLKSSVLLFSFFIIVNSYLPNIFKPILTGLKNGTNNVSWLNETFPQFMKPDALPKFWGFQGVDQVDSAATPFLIVLSALITIAVIIAVISRLRRGDLTACVLVVMLLLGGALMKAEAGFGLFKWVMFIQPFVIVLIARVVDNFIPSVKLCLINHRWRLATVAAICVASAYAQAGTQFDQVFRSLDTHEYSGSGLAGASEDQLTSDLLAIKEKQPKPPHYLLDMPFDFSFHIPSLYTQGTPIIPLSWCIFGARLADAADQNQLTMIKSVIDATRDVKLRWPSGLSDDRFELPPQQQVPEADDLLLPLGSHYLSVNRRLFSVDGPLKPIRFSNVKDYLVVVPTSVSASPDLHLAFSSINRGENDPYSISHEFYATGRLLLLRALNPSPKARLALEYTRTLAADQDNRLPPAVMEDSAGKTIPVGFIGRGSARIFSPPVPMVELNGGSYLMLDFGLPAKTFPYSPTGLTALFGASYNPDPRRMVGWARDISLVPENIYQTLHPPQKISHFPNDLANRDLEYSGFYEDGWAGEDSFVRLAGNHKEARLVLKGQFPGGVTEADDTPSVSVSADGVELGKRDIQPGDFALSFDLPATTNPTVKIKVHGSASYHLPGADGRIASFRLLSLGWSDADAAPSPVQLAASTPAALASLSQDKFQSEGVFADGWMGQRASFTFDLGASKRAGLTISGDLPGSVPDAAIKISVNGVSVAEQVVSPGDFTLRLPIAPVDGTVRLELESDKTLKLSPPDTRTASIHISHIEWNGDQPNDASSSPRTPPALAALSNEPFQARGVYRDGWVDKQASFAFKFPDQQKTTLSITGELPGGSPNGASSEDITISINGAEVAEKTILPGDFTIDVPLADGVKGAVTLKIEANTSFPLLPPDRRTASFLIQKIQWD